MYIFLIINNGIDPKRISDSSMNSISNCITTIMERIIEEQYNNFEDKNEKTFQIKSFIIIKEYIWNRSFNE